MTHFYTSSANLSALSDASDLEPDPLHGICRNLGVFWNSSLSWWTNHPDFSPCFEKLAIDPTPCVAFFLMLLLRCVLPQSKTSAIIQWGCVSYLRLIFLIILLTSVLVDLCFNLYHFFTGHTSALIIAVPLVQFITYSSILCLNFWHHRKNNFSCGVSWITFLLCCVCYIFEIQSVARQWAAGEPFEVFHFVLMCISYISYISLLIVYSLPLKQREYRFTEDRDQQSCPEPTSSFPGQMFFLWPSKVISHGYRNTLEMKDLFFVNAEQQCDYIMSEFYVFYNQLFGPYIRAKSETNPENIRFEKGNPSLVWLCLKYSWPTLLLGALYKLCNDGLIFMNPQLLKLLVSFTSDHSQPLWHGLLFAALMFLTNLLINVIMELYFDVTYKTGMTLRAGLTSIIFRKSLKLSNGARQQWTTGEITNLMSVDADHFEYTFADIHLVWSSPLQIAVSIYFLHHELGNAIFIGFAAFVLLVPVNFVAFYFSDIFQTKQMAEKDRRINPSMHKFKRHYIPDAYLTIDEQLVTCRLRCSFKVYIKSKPGRYGILNQVVKLCAWEPAFTRQVQEVRRSEMNYLKKSYLTSVGIDVSFNSGPLLLSICTFVAYVLMSPTHTLSARSAFVAISLFKIIEFPLSVLPMMCTEMIQFVVSMKRVRKFLMAEELSELALPAPADLDTAVRLDGASFTWKTADANTLNEIEFSVKKGGFVGIVGTVGSGKSSLLSAMFGEMYRTAGSASRSGRIGYVPQEAWIQNMTLRDNILFASPFVESRYDRVIDACSLRTDCGILSAGDQTEIGERGINLSGGQKQRVSLARAVYQDCDIYLLDDPLSAVDVHVGKELYQSVIGNNGCLKEKTRVLVTHHLKYVTECDQVYMMQDGKVAEVGTYSELVARNRIFADYLVSYMQNTDEEEKSDIAKTIEAMPIAVRNSVERRISEAPTSVSPSRISVSPPNESSLVEHLIVGSLGDTSRDCVRAVPLITKSSSTQPSLPSRTNSTDPNKPKDIPANDAGRLVDEEEVQVGRVPIQTYLTYIRASGILWYLQLMFSALGFASLAASSIWLAHWTDSMGAGNGSNDTGQSAMSIGLALGVYGGLGAFDTLMTAMSSIMVAYAAVKGSKLIHARLLDAILKAPVSFFETTPTGRIINRCGKDMDTIDTMLPFNLYQSVDTSCRFLVLVISVMYAVPFFIFAFVPAFVIYYFIFRYYVETNRQLRRLSSVSKSPIYALFQECLQGTSSIRAYGQQARFTLYGESLIDRNNTAVYSLYYSNRWLGIRLGIIGSFLVLATAIFAVVGRANGISAGLVGLCLAYSTTLTEELSWGVKCLSRLETQVVAVERVEEYTNTVSEAPWYSDSPTSLGLRPTWPEGGAISFRLFNMRYREGLDLVLKDLNFDIDPGEHVGIVGRTGAGKSSLTLALFRIIEPASGSILIDGVDSGKLGLHELRTKLSIIPQDPVMFSGAMRLNLDPFDQFTDDELWKVLEICSLKDYISKLDKKLDEPVSEGGGNLSVGQRQLLCLGRALLKNSKILVMDEATAAVDPQTDKMIQAMIREQFKNRTVITIAHRLQTIMDYDKILVLETGRVVEFDTPKKLLQNETGMFAQMVQEANLKS